MKFNGIIPALVTPLKEDETINIPVLEMLMEALLKQGADGFYVAGATGEGLALSPQERCILAQESIRIASKRKPCIIQVASTDFSQAVALAKHAEAAGASAISATPPLFFGYDEREVYHYYKRLAESVHIPLMIYYNPAAGFSINATFAAKMFEVDNITAIKWTSSDYSQIIRLKDMTHGEMNVMNGPDATLLLGLCAGADGGIGTTYNYLMQYYRRIYDSFIAGNLDMAQEVQQQVSRILAARPKYPGIPLTKAILEITGFPVGNATFPMCRLTTEEKEYVAKCLRDAGLRI